MGRVKSFQFRLAESEGRPGGVKVDLVNLEQLRLALCLRGGWLRTLSALRLLPLGLLASQFTGNGQRGER
jgi:hypothetical protein